MKSLPCLIAAVLLGLAPGGLALAHGDHGRSESEARRPEPSRTQAYAPRNAPPAYGYARPAQPAYGYGQPAYGGRGPAYAPPSAYPAYPPRYPAYRQPAYPPPVYDPRNRYSSGQLAARWRRGQILPEGYRGDVIRDYGRYHLRRPPPGYYWCRQGEDFVLVALTTGLIFEVIPGGY